MPDLPDFGVAPPPFKPAEALVQLRRQLRDLRPLVERGIGYELKGLRVIELVAGAEAIDARLAHKPARQPQWTEQQLRCAADVRRLVDDVRQRLRRWEQDD